MYVFSSDDVGLLVKYDFNNHNTVWYEENFEETKNNEIIQSLVTENKFVYVGCRDNFVRKYDLNGNLLWYKDLQSDSILNIKTYGDYIYCVTYNGNTVCLSKTNGDIIWNKKLSKWPVYDLDVNNDFVFLGTDDKKLFKLNKNNGHIINKLTFDSDKITSIITNDEKIFCVSYFGYFYSINISNLEITFQHNISKVPLTYISNDNDYFYISTLKNKLYKLNSSLNISWECKFLESTDERVYFPFIINKTHVYMCDIDNNINIINKNNGNVITSFKFDMVNEQPWRYDFLTDNIIVLGTRDTHLIYFDLESFSVKNIIYGEYKAIRYIHNDNNKLYCGYGSGYLLIYDLINSNLDKKLRLHNSDILSLDKNNYYLVTSSLDKTIAVIENESNNIIYLKNPLQESYVRVVKLINDDLILGSFIGGVFLMNVRGEQKWIYYEKNKKSIFEHKNKSLSVEAITYNNSFNIIIYGSKNGFITCLDLNGNKLWEFDAVDLVLNSCFTKNNFIYFGCDSGYVLCVSVHGCPLWVKKVHDEKINQIYFYNNFLFTCSNDNSVRVSNLDGELIKPLYNHETSINSITISKI